MNYWQNKKQGHKTPGTPTHPMLPVPHECPNQQTPQQFFKNYKTTPKNMTSIRSKNIYGINPAHQHPTQKRGGTSALSQHPVSPIHIITTQHTVVPKTYWTKHTLEFSNNTPHQQHHHTQTRMQRSSSAGQWYRRSKFWATTYTTILAFMKKHKLKTLCFTSHNYEIHSKSHNFETVTWMWHTNFKSCTV